MGLGRGWEGILGLGRRILSSMWNTTKKKGAPAGRKAVYSVLKKRRFILIFFIYLFCLFIRSSLSWNLHPVLCNEGKVFLLKETMGAFDEAQTHDWWITRRTLYPLHHMKTIDIIHSQLVEICCTAIMIHSTTLSLNIHMLIDRLF